MHMDSGTSAVIIRCGHYVLVSKRKKEKQFQFPGGAFGKATTPRTAVVRSVVVDPGIVIDSSKLEWVCGIARVAPNTDDGKRIVTGAHYYVHDVPTKIKISKNNNAAEHTAWKWVDILSLNEHNMYDSAYAALILLNTK